MYVLSLLFLIVPSLLLARPCGTRWIAGEAAHTPLPAGKIAAVQQETEIVVGSTLGIAVSGDSFLRSATCRFVGENAYIFVQDNLWDVVVVQPSIDRLGKVFDRATPADSTRGIYDMATEAFGPAPDVDGDRRIFIFVIDMPDDRIVGYFDPRIATHVDPGLRKDAVYLDGYHLNSNPKLVRGTLAHEFQHLIHWGHDEDEEIWIDEGLSGYAEELVGFAETDPQMVPRFLDAPDLDLTAWPFSTSASIPHYGATYLFASFLRERYGPEMIRALVAEKRNGTFGVDEAFKDIGAVESFLGAWRLWIAANYASDDAYYGYSALGGRRVRTYPIVELPFGPKQGDIVNQWGSLSVVLPMSGNIEVEFQGEGEGRYAVWGYGMRGETGEMVDVLLDSINGGRAQWAGVDSIALVVGRTSTFGGAFSLYGRTYEPDPISTAVWGERSNAREVSLGPAYPNPFNGQVLLPLTLAEERDTELSIYNSLGQRVRVLHSGSLQGGVHQIYWDGRDEKNSAVASGYYFALAQVDGAVFMRGLMLLK
ncbi:MAG: FlgD immunoglobulin-like domain containing protein [Candidatus Latescibacterota bacterium]|nr:FlgD immunoglobulin-like domain containing protein [Candidatus Latescibacterota bacterium]